MCRGCWEEEGSPAIVNDRTKLVAGFLEVDAAEFCCLHIVTDDFNIDDSHIDFCVEQAQKEKHPTCEALALYFRDLSKDERGSALAIYEGFVAVPHNTPEPE